MKDDQYIATLAELLKIIGEKNRLEIVFSLHNQAKSVSQIIEITGLSQPLISFHLRTLRERGMVKTKREGTFVYYSLQDKGLVNVLTSLSEHLSYYKPGETDFEFKWPPWKNCECFHDE